MRKKIEVSVKTKLEALEDWLAKNSVQLEVEKQLFKNWVEGRNCKNLEGFCI